MLGSYFENFLGFLDLHGIRMACSKNLFNLEFQANMENKWPPADWRKWEEKKLNNFPYTSLIKESVWSISMSLIAFLPMPFCCGGKSFLDWPFAAPLPLPAPETAPPRAVDFFIPRPGPGPGPGRPPLREIPGSSPSHRISSGDIYH